MGDLFSQLDEILERKLEIFSLKGGEIWFMRNFLNQKDADEYFKLFYRTIPWKQESLTIYGKTHPLPRKTAWYGHEGLNYSYSGTQRTVLSWSPQLLELKRQIELLLPGHQFNSVLLNLYRNGVDKVGWHADDESEWGVNPVIASLSLGATRRFDIKHKMDADLFHKFELTNGSLIIMKGAFQHNWLHQVPAQKKVTEPRINLTFRKIELHI